MCACVALAAGVQQGCHDEHCLHGGSQDVSRHELRDVSRRRYPGRGRSSTNEMRQPATPLRADAQPLGIQVAFESCPP